MDWNVNNFKAQVTQVGSSTKLRSPDKECIAKVLLGQQIKFNHIINSDFKAYDI